MSDEKKDFNVDDYVGHLQEYREPMKRTVYVERLFSLGDFKNVKFSTALTGIPEELAKNDKVTNLLFLQGAIGCELAYRKYWNILEHITRDKTVDAIKYLEEQRQQTFEELYEEIKASVENNEETK